MVEDIDELYALPLGDFTGARNDLEKRLRKEGQRDEAAEVKALRKPTVPAWALNQAARRHAKDVARLIETGRRVRSAQEKLLGGGDRKALDQASAEQRELSRELVRAAVAIGDEAGTATGAAFEDKVGATLRAAAADDEVAAQLAAGRLEREQESVGLLGFGAVPEAKPKRRQKTKDEGAARKTAADERQAEARERKRLRALEAAQKAETRARKAADAAEKATAKERRTAERAVERLKKAEDEEEAAAAKLKEAVAEVERLDQERAEP